MSTHREFATHAPAASHTTRRVVALSALLCLVAGGCSKERPEGTPDGAAMNPTSGPPTGAGNAAPPAAGGVATGSGGSGAAAPGSTAGTLSQQNGGAPGNTAPGVDSGAPLDASDGGAITDASSSAQTGTLP